MIDRKQVRERLREHPAPGEREAERRAWEVVQAAYEQRLPVPPPRRRRQLGLALAGAALALALVLSPAGAAVRDWVSEVIEPGKERVAPALTRLPAPGRLLVESEQGPWIVHADGSSRLLGDYDAAAWSPSGMFVALASGTQLTAVVGDPAATGEPAGTVRWSLAGSRPIHDLAWAPSGFRVAYRSGNDLRVVVGDGSDDRLVAGNVAGVTPAWRPLTRSQRENLVKSGGIGTHLLAYADARHRVRIVDTDSGRERWRSRPFASGIRAIGWMPDGDAVLVVTRSELSLLRAADGKAARDAYRFTRSGPILATPSPRTGEIAAVLRSTQPSREMRSKVVLLREGREQPLLANPGRFTDLAWSPNGRWLLVAWADADQWLFVSPDTGRVRPVGNISRQFAPGEDGSAAFPRLSGWCCSP